MMILLKEDFAFKENLFYFMYICILCYNLILDELKDEEKTNKVWQINFYKFKFLNILFV